MTTFKDLIKDSFMQIKIYAPGVELNAADGALGLQVINAMLEEWSNESLACFANVEQTFALVPGQQAYTIGLTGGADIALTRPLKVLTGQGAAYIVDDNENRYPINVVEQDQWNSIGRLDNTSQLPDTLFYDAQFPLGIINIYPQPLIAYNVYFDSRLQLASVANLDVSYSLPPGYYNAIKNNLCVRLWPYYKQGDPPGIIIGLATKTYGIIKSNNTRQSPATYDNAIVSHAKSSYNIFTDGSNGRGS